MILRYPDEQVRLERGLEIDRLKTENIELREIIETLELGTQKAEKRYFDAERRYLNLLEGIKDTLKIMVDELGAVRYYQILSKRSKEDSCDYQK